MDNTKKIVPRSKLEEVKNKVSIPDYFEKVILPQMGSYYDLYPVDFDNKPVACCPLHDEDTPSFRFYSDTSSFYCFGCQKGGNIVNLHRYFTESITGTIPNYEESVDFLFNLFISGKPIENAPLQVSITQDKKSSEKSIMIDKTIPEDIKLKACKTMDSLDVLIDKDMVNATDAKNWLKEYIKSEVINYVSC